MSGLQKTVLGIVWCSRPGLAFAESMDSPSSLLPIVLQPIESPPFQYSERGLTFKGHARESIDDLKRWLKKKTKTHPNPTVGKKKDWWLAQLRLYGITTTTKMSKADMMDALKAAVVSGGLKGPSEEILQLEKKLAQTFLQANAEAREKEYASLGEEERIAKYSHRYLREKFLSGSNDETLMVFRIHQEWYDGKSVHEAAANLGLHSAGARGARNRKLIVVGKEKVEVQKEVMDWDKEYKEWRGRSRGARGRGQPE